VERPTLNDKRNQLNTRNNISNEEHINNNRGSDIIQCSTATNR